jgi:photosystem II stability/assembly factor-like uncharacterized protein
MKRRLTVAVIFILMLALSIPAQYTWSTQTCPVEEDLISVSFTDINSGWIVTTDGTVLHTDNSGLDWSVVNQFPEFIGTKIFFQDQNRGWVTGHAPAYPGEAFIMGTLNGGESWDGINFELGSMIVNDIFFIDDTMGWAVGADFIGDTTNLILYTENGGSHWTRQDTLMGIESLLYSVHFRDTNSGHICGRGPTFLHTGSGGRQNNGNDWWLNIAIPTVHKDFYDLVCSGDQYSCAVGDSGTIIFTRDNWTIYNEYNSDDQNTLTAITGRTVTSYWAVGKNGTILLLTYVPFMYVLNISEQVSGTDNHLNDVCSVDLDHAWCVGENGTILYYGPELNSLPAAAHTGLPQEFRLDQNCPNPFNPATTISYSLANNTNVLVKVYTLLGEEVSTVVDGVQGAGNHSIDYNAAHLASGIYIYTIRTNEYFQARKMILVK